MVYATDPVKEESIDVVYSVTSPDGTKVTIKDYATTDPDYAEDARYFTATAQGVYTITYTATDNAKNTVSNISNKSVSLNNSNLNFIINSYVSSEMIRSVLNQETRIITFGDSNAKVSPNMFIDTDDVVASHGSFVGAIRRIALPKE